MKELVEENNASCQYGQCQTRLNGFRSDQIRLLGEECATVRCMCCHVALLILGPGRKMDDNDAVCWNLALLCTNWKKSLYAVLVWTVRRSHAFVLLEDLHRSIARLDACRVPAEQLGQAFESQERKRAQTVRHTNIKMCIVLKAERALVAWIYSKHIYVYLNAYKNTTFWFFE